MTYDMQAHRARTRDHLLRLAAAGPGWHAYAIHEAEHLVKQDPVLHGGLMAAVEAEMGMQAAAAARRAAQWMLGGAR